MGRRLVGAVALALLVASCRDEDIADEPILPDNVDASVAECGVVEAVPLTVVEITNGTGHTARFEVSVAFERDGRVEGTAAATSDDIRPGASAPVRVSGPGDVAAVDDCSIEDVVDLSS